MTPEEKMKYLVDTAVPYETWQEQHRNGNGHKDVPRFTIKTEAALMDLPPLKYLDRELGMVAGCYHLIYGASGSGKTFFAIERAMRQASLGRRVLYIATEDTQGLRYRVVAWRKTHPEGGAGLTWLETPDGLDLQNPLHVETLLSTIEPHKYDLIVLDTLRESHSGDENSSRDTSAINRAIQRFIAAGAAVDVVHHTGVNGERPRGSTALFGNADVVIKVENDDGLIRISYDKIRNAAPRDSIAFGLVQQDTELLDNDGQSVVSCILRPAAQFTRRDTKITSTQRKVLETLALSIFEGVGAKAQQVIDISEITRRHVYLALAALKKRELVDQAAKGDPFYITAAGRAQLAPELTPAPSDLDNSAPGSASDPCDLDVISSDLHNPDTDRDVIHSDHTHRVITGSHTDHIPDHPPAESQEMAAPAGTLARVDWAKVEQFLRAGDRDRVRGWCALHWRPATYAAVMAESAVRWPELFKEATP